MILDEVTGGILSLGEVYSPEHIPVGISMTSGIVDRSDLNHWWLGRSIPASRSGLRDALERMSVSSPQLLLSKCYGLSLSDQYWVRPMGQELRWSEINFFNNTFSEDVGDILFGMAVENKEVDLRSPDNTSDGLLKKRWKITNGERCLIKGGSAPFYQEPLNEIFASRLMDRLGIAHVPYSLTWIDGYPYSVCPDFVTPDTELVSAHHILKTIAREPSESKFKHFLRCCDALEIPNMQPMLDQMLTLDYLLANEDRHTNNFGALRNAETLEWLGPAPVFDCGTSLWHDSLFRWGGPGTDSPSKPFETHHSEQITLVQSFNWLDFSAMDSARADLEELLLSAPRFVDDLRRETLCDGFLGRVRHLRDYVQTLKFGGTDFTMELL
jgi:hypothetical protein